MITLNKILGMMPNGSSIHVVRSFNHMTKVRRRALSVRYLAQALGFSVVRKKLPRGIAGRLVQDPFSDNGFCIEVNEREHILRQRFTVLHEIGHYFLHIDHKEIFEPVRLRGPNGSHFYLEDEVKEEREANEFAEAILFDDGALEAANAFFKGDVKEMSKYFGVSESVIKIGMRNFLRNR